MLCGSADEGDIIGNAMADDNVSSDEFKDFRQDFLDFWFAFHHCIGDVVDGSRSFGDIDLRVNECFEGIDGPVKIKRTTAISMILSLSCSKPVVSQSRQMNYEC